VPTLTMISHQKYTLMTDASNYQLGACIMQDDHPVAYYSRKLKSAQCNNATVDKELFYVIATLKKFQCSYLAQNCTLTQTTRMSLM
jgi:hypothetical protein